MNSNSAADSRSSKTPPKSDRRLFAIFLIVLIDVLGMTIILPLLPFYSEHFGASPFVVGLLVSSYAVCQLVSGPILGYWSDQIGRKPILIISQIGTLCGFLVLAFANSLAWIFVARIIDGLTAGNLSTAQAYITDVAEPRVRAQALGKIGVAFGVGFFIGPALTAFLYRYGYNAPIFAAAGLSACSILASSLLLPNGERPPRHTAGANAAASSSGEGKSSATKRVPFRLFAFTKYFRQLPLASLLIQILFFYFAFSAYISGFPLFAERRFTFNGVALGPQQIGYIYTYSGFLGIIIQGFLIGRLVQYFGEKRLAAIGFLSSFIGYGLLGFIHEPLWIAITALFTGFGAGVLRPVLTSEISECVGPHERGTIMGVNQSLQSIAQIIAPLISTAVIAREWLAAWPWFPGIISGGALILIIFQRRSAKAKAARV